MTFLQGRRPRIIAHRGLALDAPENTLLAFLRALNAGATHLETDVHASADGVAVISHDPDLGRVAGRSVNVGQLTMPELRRVDLGHGQGFCSLAEALDAFPQARFNIDIKDEASAAPASRWPNSVAGTWWERTANARNSVRKPNSVRSTAPPDSTATISLPFSTLVPRLKIAGTVSGGSESARGGSFSSGDMPSAPEA